MTAKTSLYSEAVICSHQFSPSDQSWLQTASEQRDKHDSGKGEKKRKEDVRRHTKLRCQNNLIPLQEEYIYYVKQTEALSKCILELLLITTARAGPSFPDTRMCQSSPVTTTKQSSLLALLITNLQLGQA